MSSGRVGPAQRFSISESCAAGAYRSLSAFEFSAFRKCLIEKKHYVHGSFKVRSFSSF